MADPIIQAYRRQSITEEYQKSIDGNVLTAIPEDHSAPKYRGTAIDSRGKLPYDPTEATNNIRKTLQSEDHNKILKNANEYTKSNFGHVLDVDPSKFPQSSLRKQYAIGKMYDIAASGNPEYKKAVYADYAKNQPEIIKATGARDYDSLISGSYKAASKETGNQFDHLGLKVQFHPGHLNYDNSNEMLRDIHLHNNLTTYQGGDRHEFLHDIHPKLGVTSNDILRAVHDGYAHGIAGSSFGPKGEEVAYHIHSQMYTPHAKIAVASETRGQNSNVNYTGRNHELQKSMESLRKEYNTHLNNGDVEKANEVTKKLRDTGSQWRYAEQKSVALPSAMIQSTYSGKEPEYVRKLLKDPQSDHTDVYDATKDHLNLVDLARFHNTGSHSLASPEARGKLNQEGAMSDLMHMASLHGFRKLSHNPYKD